MNLTSHGVDLVCQKEKNPRPNTLESSSCLLENEDLEAITIHPVFCKQYMVFIGTLSALPGLVMLILLLCVAENAILRLRADKYLR